jgi:hypothetical protein
MTHHTFPTLFTSPLLRCPKRRQRDFLLTSLTLNSDTASKKAHTKVTNIPHSLHLSHHHTHTISICYFIILSGGNLTYFFDYSTLNYLLFLGSFSVVCSFIGYQTRGAAPSNFDVNYAYNLGFAATRLILDGFSGYMATIGSLRERVEDWQPAGVPITALMAWYVQHIVHTTHYPHSTPNPIRDQ